MDILLRFKSGETWEADVDLAEEFLEVSQATGAHWPMADGTTKEEFKSRMFKRDGDTYNGRAVYREVTSMLGVELT